MALPYANGPRYFRVVADQFIDTPNPRYERRCCYLAQAEPSGERPRYGSVVPGTALILGPALPPLEEKPTPTFALAGLNPTGAVYIADVNTLAGKGLYDWWDFGAIEAIAMDGRALNVLVRSGASVVKGGGLTTDALGRFLPAGPGDRVIMTADETFNNNTGVYQHVRALPVIGA